MKYTPVTHYNPFRPSYDPYGEDSSEHGYCGTLLSEEFDNSTNKKEYVSCKKCVKLFEKAKEEMNFHSKNFGYDCQGFLDFMDDEKEYCNKYKWGDCDCKEGECRRGLNT